MHLINWMYPFQRLRRSSFAAAAVTILTYVLMYFEAYMSPKGCAELIILIGVSGAKYRKGSFAAVQKSPTPQNDYNHQLFRRLTPNLF